MEIRQAKEKDIPVIEDILKEAEAWLESLGLGIWGKEQMTWDGLSKDYQVGDFYIASADGVPVGCMALVDYDPEFWPDIEKGGSLFMHRLAVRRFAAKTGVPSALIAFAKDRARRLGVNLRLDCMRDRSKLRKLYKNHGFVCVGEKNMWNLFTTALYVWERK